MYINQLISMTDYDMLSIIITSRNRNANGHTALLYFQTSDTYSHIHTSTCIITYIHTNIRHGSDDGAASGCDLPQLFCGRR